MRHEIETHPQKFDLSLDEFDIFFKEFVSDGNISDGQFQDLIADFEVRLAQLMIKEEEEKKAAGLTGDEEEDMDMEMT